MTSRGELLRLLNHFVEGTLSDDGHDRVSELLLSDEAIIDVYVEFMSLHGLLVWDVGAVVSEASSSQLVPVNATKPGSAVSSGRKTIAISVAIAAVLTVVGLGGMGGLFGPSENTTPTTIVENVRHGDSSDASISANPLEELLPAASAPIDYAPLTFQTNDAPLTERRDSTATDGVVAVKEHGTPLSDELVAARIDQFLKDAMEENEVLPSPQATDAEWVRRVYLTVVGRIPSLPESQTFLADSTGEKHQQLLHRVLESPQRAENLARVWTNLLVGRTQSPKVNRAKLFEFLEASFAENVSWASIVAELISARGRNDEAGATNFLLAHLNNQATPATAVSARLFLGQQIHCVQCHDHPFDRNVRQQDYWALNAFFKDTKRSDVSTAMLDAEPNGRQPVWRLSDDANAERMTHFENRKGQTLAVLPRFGQRTLAANATSNRREELAKFLIDDPDATVAQAMVNRMWQHFFGFGFTSPVDDMGPHTVVSHPELLRFLSLAFVESGYDLRRLMKWIGSTQAWQRSSVAQDTNATDQPDAGDMPLFSRVYPRRMTPEQVYESIRVAVLSTAGVSVREHRPEVEAHRQDWVAQFTMAYGTDENDESLRFDGTVSQAMVMMNGPDIDKAIRLAAVSIGSNEGKKAKRITEILERVAMSILAREPTPAESTAFRHHLRNLPSTDRSLAIEDMMWAYLNSSEFVMLH